MIIRHRRHGSGCWFFSGAHDKATKEFRIISEKRVFESYKLHSYDTCVKSRTMITTKVWEKS
mgnify:CR=1 FL=1